MRGLKYFSIIAVFALVAVLTYTPKRSVADTNLSNTFGFPCTSETQRNITIDSKNRVHVI